MNLGVEEKDEGFLKILLQVSSQTQSSLLFDLNFWILMNENVLEN
jgi:hypothetical protein